LVKVLYRQYDDDSSRLLLCVGRTKGTNRMSDNNNSNSSHSIGFLGLLQIVFITLKLCKVINWSWWLVLLPLWADVALLITIIVLIIIFK
jgi:ABC-type siderophore export system fused ATPase/permease subunit